MNVDESISKYDHPYVTVDGVLFRFDPDCGLCVKLCQPVGSDQWRLPGGFMPVDRLAVDVLREKVLEKAGEEGFYAEQLQTYDALDRDGRGRIVSIAYLCLCPPVSSTSRQRTASGYEAVWIPADEVLADGGLAFDHTDIIRDARTRLVNKLWYSDLARYLLPDEFRLSWIQGMYELLEEKEYYTNFKRNMGDRIVATGAIEGGAPGRKAALYKWNDGWKGD